MPTIDFRTDPVKARRHRVVSLVTCADILDIVWADQDRQREEVTTPNRHNAELGGGQSVADAGTRIP